MNKFKLILSVFFLLIGLSTAFLTYSLSNKDSLGYTEQTGRLFPRPIITTGIDSSNDGVAIGLGTISGLSFLSSALLLSSLKN